MSDHKIRIEFYPHPFDSDPALVLIKEAGLTVKDLIVAAVPDGFVRARVAAALNDHFLDAKDFARIRPKAGTVLTLRAIPRGGRSGGRKNPARLLVSLALTALSPLTAKASALLGGRVVSLGMSFVSRLLYNAIAPPARARFPAVKESPTLFLQGARNNAIPFGRVPCVLGTHRMVPPLGAPVYTETEGAQQYLRMLFVWGYGPLQITDLKIGETPLSAFDGIEIETRQGYEDDPPVALYSNTVLQNDLQVTLSVVGGSVLRTTDPDADEISVDITFPRGLFTLADTGAKVPRTVRFSIAYAPKGSQAWIEETLTWTAAQGAALRQGARFIVSRGQYDVRVQRISPDSTRDEDVDDAVWTALRTIRQASPIKMKGLALTALRIKATDQLNGVVDRFNGVVSSILPDWDGAAWIPRVTSNPASLYRAILQGKANARAVNDQRLDLVKIQDWHAYCLARGQSFHAVIDYDVSVRGVLQDVAAAGRASPTFIDGKWSVAIDRPQTVPVQHFTPRNTWGFAGEKNFEDPPHALRVRFIHRDKGWLQDEILVFQDGYDATTATRYDVLELNGITDAAQAWRDARYHLATARLRPETYSFHADIEHIVCSRGDLVRLTHDVPLFGLGSARVKSLIISESMITGVVFDESFAVFAGITYAARFRTAEGGSLVSRFSSAAAGTFSSFMFETPFALTEGPRVGDLALFGESGQESVALIIQSIEPQRDLTARITCVDAAPDIYLAEDGEMPNFSAQVTLPPELQRPPAPVVAGVRTQQGQAFLTLDPSGFPLPLSIDIRIRFPEESNFRAAFFSVSDVQVVVSDLVPGLRYDFALFYRSQSGLSSVQTVLPNVLIEGTGGIPQDVQNLSLNIIGQTAHLSWTAVDDADLDYYRIKFSNASQGATWATSFESVAKVSKAATTVTLPAQVGTWLMKAVNVAGHESHEAATIVSSLDRIEGYSLQLSANETPSLSGPLPSGSLGVTLTSDHRLILAAGVLEGIYIFGQSIDLGAVYPSLLSATLEVLGINAANQVDGWNSIDLIEDWDGAADPTTWGVQLQVRSTQDDSQQTPHWTPWQNFLVGSYTARAFQFRLLMSSGVMGVTPSISTLKIDLAMPTWSQDGSGMVSLSTHSPGTRVDYADSFHAIGAMTVTPQDMAPGDSCTILNKDRDGFTIRFQNAAGGRVTRTFDYIATGIGRKVST